MYICQLVWKKINQEITVVYNQFLYWHKQKKNKKPSHQEEFLKKKLKLQITARTNPLERKNRKKSYPYVHIFIFSV